MQRFWLGILAAILVLLLLPRDFASWILIASFWIAMVILWRRYFTLPLSALEPPPTRQLLAELVLIACIGLSVTTPYWLPDPNTQLRGVEAEWLTSPVIFAADTLREEGYFPLWQPYLDEWGTPLVDNPFSSVLNPLVLVPSLLAGGVAGIKLSVTLHTLIAGWGGWFLARSLGLAWLARLLLACLLMGKGNMVVMFGAGYFQLAAQQAYFPWVVAGLLGIYRWRDQRFPIWLTAVSFTLLFFAGNIWYTLPMLMVMAFIVLVYGYSPRALLSAAFTLGLSAILLLPLWLQRDHIGGHDFEVPGGHAVPMELVIERYLSDSYSGDIYQRDPPELYFSFVAPLWFAALIFVLLPLGIPQSSHWQIWLVGLASIGCFTLWGAGGNQPFIWLYEQFALLARWRFVGRALAMSTFWIAVLVAVRVDGIWQAIPQSIGWLRWLVMFILILTSVVAAQQVLRNWSVWGNTAPISDTTPDEACLDSLRQREPKAELAVFRQSYQVITPYFDHRIRLTHIGAAYTPLPIESTLPEISPMPPRYGMAFAPDEQAVLESLGYTPTDVSCLWQYPNTPSYAFWVTETDLNPIVDVERRADRIRLVATTAEATIVVQELAYPGWQVEVNGENARLESVGGLMGVQVPNGTHRIVFSYQPRLVFIGSVISVITLMIMMGFGVGQLYDKAGQLLRG